MLLHMSHSTESNDFPSVVDQPRTIKPSTNIHKNSSSNLINRRGRRRSTNSVLPCSICGELYSRRDNLKVHQRVHSGEKPFKCEECGAKFRWVGVLRTHQATHRRRAEEKKQLSQGNNRSDRLKSSDYASSSSIALEMQHQNHLNGMQASNGDSRPLPPSQEPRSKKDVSITINMLLSDEKDDVTYNQRSR